jgi:hypothetical protein
MKANSLIVSSFVLAAVLGAGVGCAKKPDDAQISGEIQSKFSQDSGLSTKQLVVETADGVVTLTGTVDNDAQRQAASRQAAVAGVKTVVNNLQVGMVAGVPSKAARAASPAGNSGKPKAGNKSRRDRAAKDSEAAGNSGDGKSEEMAANNTAPADAGPPATATPPADAIPAAPPAPPTAKKYIIDQGTPVTVRLIDPIDSEKNQTGDTFRATLNAPLTSDGDEAVPAGVELTGHLVEVKSASKFAGQSLVAMQLDSLATGGKTYNLQTDQYKKETASRGKNTAEKVGGGAVIGSLIGAIAGGGKGAAIGAAAGAGVGGGAQAASKSQQVKLPSETVLNFTLQAPVTVERASGPDADRQKLSDPK